MFSPNTVLWFSAGDELSQRSKPGESKILATNKVLNRWKHSPGPKESSGHLKCVCVARHMFVLGGGEGPIPLLYKGLEFLDILHRGGFIPRESA